MMFLVMKSHDLFADVGLESIVCVWEIGECVLRGDEVGESDVDAGEKGAWTYCHGCCLIEGVVGIPIVSVLIEPALSAFNLHAHIPISSAVILIKVNRMIEGMSYGTRMHRDDTGKYYTRE